MRVAGTILAAIAVAASLHAAQQPLGDTARMFKRLAPVADARLAVELPPAQDAVLPNGARLVFLEDRRAPTISIEIFVPGAGTYYDPVDRPELASITAALMQEGTPTRPAATVAQELGRLAATLTITTAPGSELATMSVTSLTEHLDQVLAIAADVITNPAFAAEDLKRVKASSRAAALQRRASSRVLATEAFARAVYAEHPAGRVLPPEAIDDITEADVRAFHRRTYVPDHALIGLAGDLSFDEARRKVAAAFKNWRRSGIEPPVAADARDRAATRVLLVDRPGAPQTTIIVGALGVARTSPDFEPLTVMNHIIGGGPAARLFTNLRERRGLTYNAASELTARRYRGTWQASADTRTEATVETLEGVLAEIRRVRDEPVPPAELRAAQRTLVTRYVLALESPATLLTTHLTGRLYDLPRGFSRDYVRRIDAVTAAAVQRTAQQYLAPDRLWIVAVGDAARIAEPLRSLGEVDMRVHGVVP